MSPTELRNTRDRAIGAAMRLDLAGDEPEAELAWSRAEALTLELERIEAEAGDEEGWSW